VLKGRLGLETARIPHSDRHGLCWLERGNLVAEDGTVSFRTAGFADLPPGTYAIPHQTVSFILLGPGATLSHDAARILARHSTGLAMVGEGGVRLYASLPAAARSSHTSARTSPDVGRSGEALHSGPADVRVASGRDLPRR
jgi:CRISPR-associated protein Cas1